MSAELKEIVRWAARRHVAESHPERLEELDAVFDAAFESALESPPAPTADPQQDLDRGIRFDPSLTEVSVVGFAVLGALQLVQIALAQGRRSRWQGLEERLRRLVEDHERLTAQQRRELGQLARQVALAVQPWPPWEPAEPVAVEALQLLVERRDRGGRPLLEFRLHGRKGERSYLLRPFGERALEREPERYFEELLAQLVSPAAGHEDDPRAADRWVRARGAYLFETLLPEPLQAELRRLAPLGGDLLVVSEEPWIPWELLKFPATGEGSEGRFLSEAFTLARWLAGEGPATRLPVRRMALVRSQAFLEGADEEADFLLAQAVWGRRRVQSVPARYLALTDAMARGGYDAWHFIGHGAGSSAGGEWWRIELDDREMNPQDLSDQVAAGFGAGRPFVFLNACRTAGGAPGLAGLSGWPARFLQIGAGSYLGPLWPVPSGCAAAFARLFYARLLSGEPIGRAVHGARLELRDHFPGDPTWLAYALYADPGAVSPPGAEVATSRGTAAVPASHAKAWSDKREYKRLARRLSTLTGADYENLVLRLVRAAAGAWDEEPAPLEEGSWAFGNEPPYSLVVQILRFEAAGEDLGEDEIARIRSAADWLQRRRFETGRYLLVHNRHAGSARFRSGADAALRHLGASDPDRKVELWSYQELLRRAFGGMLHLLVSETRRRSLSLATVDEVLGRASWRDEPLERVPLRTSVLVADQHRLVGEEDAASTVADPAAKALAGQERSITLLLGAFGFGKTTALARALVEHDGEVFFVPAAGISEEVHGAKDLLSRCVDLDGLLQGVPEADREDYRLLARPIIEYVLKQKKIDAVLVLDGLDESPFLARAGGLQNLFNNLWDLRVPVVLSMRTEFWDDKLQDFEASFGDRAAHGERRVRRIRKVELLPWRDEEIRAFLERFAATVEDEAARRRLDELAAWLDDGRFERIYGDIPRRPLFLRLIAETVAAEGLPGRQVGRARLLADAARIKIRRDVTAPRRAGGPGRPSILGREMDVGETVELAWQAMTAAAASMTRPAGSALELLPDCLYRELHDAVPRLQDMNDPLPLILHSLLRPSEPRTGMRPRRLRFAHRVFQEFFLAWHLVESGRWRTAEVPESVASWIDDLRREELVAAS